MPTVLTQNGFQVLIYTQDHLPPHVHVTRAEFEAIIYLDRPAGEASARANYGFRSSDLKDIVRLVSEHRAYLLQAWEEIHGILR